MVQRWLILVLDLMCAVITLFVIVLVVELRNTVSPGFTGVALVNIITLATNMADMISM